jgi:hypothetical protein
MQFKSRRLAAVRPYVRARHIKQAPARALNELIRQPGVEAIHIDRGTSDGRQRLLRDNDRLQPPVL